MILTTTHAVQTQHLVEDRPIGIQDLREGDIQGEGLVEAHIEYAAARSLRPMLVTNRQINGELRALLDRRGVEWMLMDDESSPSRAPARPVTGAGSLRRLEPEALSRGSASPRNSLQEPISRRERISVACVSMALLGFGVSVFLWPDLGNAIESDRDALSGRSARWIGWILPLVWGRVAAVIALVVGSLLLWAAIKRPKPESTRPPAAA